VLPVSARTDTMVVHASARCPHSSEEHLWDRKVASLATVLVAIRKTSLLPLRQQRQGMMNITIVMIEYTLLEW